MSRNKRISALVGLVCLLAAVPAAAAPDLGAPLLPTGQTRLQPVAGELVDVAPFGEIRGWAQPKAVGVVWEDARDVLKLVARLAPGAVMPALSSVKVQYWRDRWPQDRIPRDRLAGSGGSGWMEVGDWYNARWQDADAVVAADGDILTVTFRPVNKAEFPDVGDYDATYRTTMKVRIVSDALPMIAELHAFTDSTWQPVQAIVEWGGTAKKSAQVWDGKAEAFNGWVANVKTLAGSKIRLNPDATWQSTVKGTTDGVVLDLWYAKSPAVDSFDQTVVTLRAKRHTFSFAPQEIAEGRRIYIRDMGVLIKPVRDSATFQQVEADYAKAPKDVYRRVFDVPEQTLANAWSNMPKKGRIYMPLSLEGTRQHFRLNPKGHIQLYYDWFDRVKGEDTPKAAWIGRHSYQFTVGMPEDGETGASIEDGILPIATTWYEKDGVRYTQEAFATTLSGKLPKEGRVRAEEPVVCMVRFAIADKSGKPRKATLPITLRKEPLELTDGIVNATASGKPQVRLLVDANGAARLALQDEVVNCSVDLAPNQTKVFYVKIPFLTPASPEEVAQLRALNYDQQRRMIADFWRKRIRAGSQVKTPDQMINNFYAANATHQLINCESEVGNTGRLMAKVGTFSYGVYSNESVMMATELDRRGYHDTAERVYETWIHYQGTAALPGDYDTKEGVFYGANGYQAGGYNQHHGWVLWGLAEHYWFTRDKAWLDRVAPNIIKACDWIISQRSRTKTDDYTGLRAIEYGLLPPGSLEDIGDWRSWVPNNVFSWWGMDNAARALAAAGHPEAQRLLKEANDYKSDIRRAVFEAMNRSPVVRLRDGTCIPILPSDVHRRGRSFGWITETLEGSIHLIRCGIVDPEEPVAKWIMQDYEDNRYLSDQFGYQPEDFERDWFWMGGFSQQPSLLCSPTPYIQRDEPKHYVRSYFNAFAAGYFPERAMLTEHPLPNLGDYRGDHFKSSDEAMNTSWIRWMFVWDEGPDLHLGRTIPRYWLKNGSQIGIERTVTHFGPMSMSMKSSSAKGRIEMTIDPPKRNPPRATYARFRHPEGKRMTRVTVNGKPWKQFDAAKEWVVLPALKAKTVVVAHYGR